MKPQSCAIFCSLCLAGCSVAPEGGTTLPGLVCNNVEHCLELCDAGEAKGCMSAGMVLSGSGVARQPMRAAEAYSRACNRGATVACELAAELLLEQKSRRADRRAAALLAHACEEKIGRACTRRAVLNESADPGEAAVWYERGCELQHGPACTALGLMHEIGLMGARSVREARAYYVQACELSDARGCDFAHAVRSGDRAGAAGPELSSRDYLHRRCAEGAGHACALLGEAATGSGVRP